MSINDATELYRHFDEEGKLLYVGISVSAVGRLVSHKRLAGWYGYISRIDVERYPTRRDAEEAERQAIISELPEWNKLHHPDNKPAVLNDAKAAPPRHVPSRDELHERLRGWRQDWEWNSDEVPRGGRTHNFHIGLHEPGSPFSPEYPVIRKWFLGDAEKDHFFVVRYARPGDVLWLFGNYEAVPEVVECMELMGIPVRRYP